MKDYARAGEALSDKEALKTMLLRHEGLRLRPYRDSTGRLTIGVGRNLTDVGISHDEAMMLLDADIERALRAFRACARLYGVDAERLPRRVRLALSDMAFNLGYRLSGFRRMWKALASGDYDRAADEMLDSRWARQVARRATELSAMVRSARENHMEVQP